MSAAVSTNRAGLLQALARVREVGLFAVLAALALATAAINPRFLGAQGLKDILEDVAVTALLCVGETIVLLMRQVDLSISSILGLTAYATGAVFLAYPGMPIPLVMAIGALAGAALGALNGGLVAWGGVPSLVATLGTLYVFRGADFAWVKGAQINATSLPKDFLALATAGVGAVPFLALIVVGLIALSGYALRHYPGGREYFALGSNEEAARLAGIDVRRRLMLGFVCCGAIAGFAGVLFTARFGTVDATAGSGLELHVIA
ncbi:MAG: ABC transporter permease, partial [Acetobacteraceae bacterium]